MQKIVIWPIAMLILIFMGSCEGQKDRSLEEQKSIGFPNSLSLADSVFCPKEPINQVEGPDQSFRFERGFLEDRLSIEGLTGYIHGVSLENRQFVFSYRSEDPMDSMAFFKAEEMSLVTRELQIKTILVSLKRHDKVRVFGRLSSLGKPLRHILVEKMDIIQRFNDTGKYEGQIDENLFAGKLRIQVMADVHAIIDGGKGLVLDYKRELLPVAVPAQLWSKSEGLYRSDIVLADLAIKRSPNRPLHFEIDSSLPNALQIVDSIQNCHGVETWLEGSLVKFQKSPQINQDIYAIKVVDNNGIARNFTFFPKIDFDKDGAQEKFKTLFSEISTKARNSWEKNLTNVVQGRNHQYQPEVKVRVGGTMNIVSKSQANPQIYIKNTIDLVIQ